MSEENWRIQDGRGRSSSTRASDWLPALGFSVAVHTALAMLIDMPWPDEPNRPPIVHPIRISLGVATPKSSDELASDAGRNASARKVATESLPSESMPTAARDPVLRERFLDPKRPALADPILFHASVADRVGEKTAPQPVEPAVPDVTPSFSVQARKSRPDSMADAPIPVSWFRRPALDFALAEFEAGIGRRDSVTMDRLEAAHHGIKAEYAVRIQALLTDHRRYPRRARLLGQQGRASLSFVLDRQGRVVESRIEQSSGHELLDREALAMVDRAQPLPPLPEQLLVSNLQLIVPVEFHLR